MLEEKLDVAIDDSWVPAEANANLIEQLAGHHVQYSPFGLAYQAAPWTSIGPLEDKVVRDVDVGGLSVFLHWSSFAEYRRRTNPTRTGRREPSA